MLWLQPLNLGTLVPDLPLPSDGGGEAGGADLQPKSLCYERAMGRCHRGGRCPGGCSRSVAGMAASPFGGSHLQRRFTNPWVFGALRSKSAWLGERLPSQHVTGNLFPGAVI